MIMDIFYLLGLVFLYNTIRLIFNPKPNVDVMMMRAAPRIIDAAYFFWGITGLILSHDRLLFFLIAVTGVTSYVFIKKSNYDEPSIRHIVVVDAVVSALILTLICLRNLIGL